VAKKKKTHRKQLDRARARRAAFARRQRRRKRLTQIFVGGMIAILSLLMVVTLMPGDLGALFGGAAEPEIEDPADDPFAEEELGGVACDGEVPRRRTRTSRGGTSRRRW
jgi:hypothetical protein